MSNQIKTITVPPAIPVINSLEDVKRLADNLRAYYAQQAKNGGSVTVQDLVSNKNTNSSLVGLVNESVKKYVDGQLTLYSDDGSYRKFKLLGIHIDHDGDGNEVQQLTFKSV